MQNNRDASKVSASPITENKLTQSILLEIPTLVVMLKPFIIYTLRNLIHSTQNSGQYPNLVHSTIKQLAPRFSGIISTPTTFFVPGRMKQLAETLDEIIDEKLVTDIINELQRELDKQDQIPDLSPLIKSYIAAMTQWLSKSSREDFADFIKEFLVKNKDFESVRNALSKALLNVIKTHKTTRLPAILSKLFPSDPLSQNALYYFITYMVSDEHLEKSIQNLSRIIRDELVKPLIDKKKENSITKYKITTENINLEKHFYTNTDYNKLRRSLVNLIILLVGPAKESIKAAITEKNFTGLQANFIDTTMNSPFTPLVKWFAKKFATVKKAKGVIDNIANLIDKNYVSSLLSKISDEKIAKIFYLVEQFTSKVLAGIFNVEYENDVINLINAKEIIQEILSAIRSIDNDISKLPQAVLLNTIDQVGSKIFLRLASTDNISDWLDALEQYLCCIIDPIARIYYKDVSEFENSLKSVCQLTNLSGADRNKLIKLYDKMVMSANYTQKQINERINQLESTLVREESLCINGSADQTIVYLNDLTVRIPNKNLTEKDKVLLSILGLSQDDKKKWENHLFPAPESSNWLSQHLWNARSSVENKIDNNVLIKMIDLKIQRLKSVASVKNERDNLVKMKDSILKITGNEPQIRNILTHGSQIDLEKLLNNLSKNKKELESIIGKYEFYVTGGNTFLEKFISLFKGNRSAYLTEIRHGKINKYGPAFELQDKVLYTIEIIKELSTKRKNLNEIDDLTNIAKLEDELKDAVVALRCSNKPSFFSKSLQRVYDRINKTTEAAVTLNKKPPSVT